MTAPPSFLFVIFLLFLVPLRNCVAAEPLTHYCGPNKPIYTLNRAKVLSSLLANASSSRFFITSYGSGISKVYGLAQCRQDVSVNDCRTCIQGATTQLPKLCPSQSDARVWYDYCFVRYDSSAFIGKRDTGYGVFYINVENVTQNVGEQRRFDQVLGSLMGQVQRKASAKGSLGLGKLETAFTPYVKIYALAQCTRDLSPLSCAQCVSTAVANFPVFCPHRKGCRALYSSCYVRYEIYPFFFPPSGRYR